MKLGPRRAAVVLASSLLMSGCSVLALTGAAAGLAVGVAGAVVGTGLTVAGKMVGAGIHAVTPGSGTAAQ
ncbi:MAG: hypothetical protein ABIX46_05015 [Burkholderiaceae bacterium]